MLQFFAISWTLPGPWHAFTVSVFGILSFLDLCAQLYLSSTMRNVKLLVLLQLACLITGEAAALALGASKLPQGSERGSEEIDETTVTSDTFRLRNGTIVQISPSTLQSEAVVYKQQVHHKGRKLGGFRECSPCTCCDSTRRWCLPTVCCYQINCGVRDLPFGICSFTPISCSCLGCRD